MRDLASPTFKVGVRRGRWALLAVKFPIAMFFVAAPVRLGGPIGFLLRSDCSGYPATAPNSQLWHGHDNQPLADAHRPKNRHGGTSLIQYVGGVPLSPHRSAGAEPLARSPPGTVLERRQDHRFSSGDRTWHSRFYRLCGL